MMNMDNRLRVLVACEYSGKSLPKWYNLPPSKDRWKIRNETFQRYVEGAKS